jgi:hypothetical protein
MSGLFYLIGQPNPQNGRANVRDLMIPVTLLLGTTSVNDTAKYLAIQ